MGGAGSRTRCACGRSFMVCCYLRIKTLTNELQPATTTISPSFECSSHSSYPLSRPQRTNHFSYRHAYIHFSLSYLLTYSLLSIKRTQHQRRVIGAAFFSPRARNTTPHSPTRR
ncbi:hypothetical protein FIBSPDRAFT_510711 [Athelia psychrophila]|uniref:Uncharacterized protein n=1 Tax=Athelia psychrophila TaxID=1759441 RepID=A0A166UYL1_9AGAM|nr:hypothetical protein FIBSPDRAFT_510711 [Fibularhizoctonia sp. CBS 109695]